MTPTSLLLPIGSLVAVLLLIFLIGRVARATRFVRLGASPNRRLRVVEALPLDPKRRLILVECDGRSVLLLASAQDQVVGWLPEFAP